MSTKIYNAFKYTGRRADLISFLVKVRQEVYQYTLDVYRRNRTSADVDYNAVYEAFYDNTIKADGFFNISGCVMVYYYKRSILLHFFLPPVVPDEFIEDKFGNVLVDYHYQNQSDKPDNISSADWNMRRRVWNHILNIADHHIFSHIGLKWILIDDRDVHNFVFDLVIKPKLTINAV